MSSLEVIVPFNNELMSYYTGPRNRTSVNNTVPLGMYINERTRGSNTQVLECYNCMALN